MDDKPWVKNAPTLILVNSIFAALAGALFAITLGDAVLTHYLPPVLFALSFLLFAFSAEEMTTAIDEQDVKRYVYVMAFYNLGVILLFIGSAALIYFKFDTCLCATILVTIALILIPPWGRDLWFLINPFNKEEIEDYLKELDGSKRPTKQPGFFAKLFYRIKGIPYEDKMKLPHDNVYTRIETSAKHGVGVFAIRDIPKGTNIFEGDEIEVVWYKVSEINGVSPEIQKLYEDFCILKDGQYGCPPNFNMLSVGWFLNESKDNPNVVSTKDYDFIALKDILKGEELLTNYSTYSE